RQADALAFFEHQESNTANGIDRFIIPVRPSVAGSRAGGDAPVEAVLLRAGRHSFMNLPLIGAAPNHPNWSEELVRGARWIAGTFMLAAC
ncbi:MAG: hypothetical protein ACKO9T_10090, partial [Nitrospira sp.]